MAARKKGQTHMLGQKTLRSYSKQRPNIKLHENAYLFSKLVLILIFSLKMKYLFLSNCFG